MLALVDRPRLLGYLQSCAAVADKHSTIIPILQCVRVDATERGLQLTATDLDLSLRVLCPAEVQSPGQFAINLQTLIEFVRNLPEDNVRLETDRAALHVTAGTTKFALPYFDADDFPVFPEAGVGDPSVIVNIGELTEGCSTVAYATGDGLDFAKGVYVTVRDRRLECVASDGRRLAVTKGVRDQADGLTDIVPLKAAQALGKLREDGDCLFGVGENHSRIEIDDVSVFAYRRIVSNFPSYQQVIPLHDEMASLTLDRKRFAEAIKRATLLTVNNNAVRIRATAGRLTATPERGERGDGSDTMPYDGLATLDIQVLLNGAYFLQALESMKAPKITFGVYGSLVMVRTVADGVDSMSSVHCLATIEQ